MATRTLDFPESTLEALEKLAEVTNLKGKNRMAKLIQDAIRTYEWVLFQQAQGRTVTAIERPDIELLTKSADVSGEREFLDPFLAPDKIREAQEYFKKAA